MLLIKDTTLDGVKLITQEQAFKDHRGMYRELYNEKIYKDLGVVFLQDDISVSHKYVLRGIHGDGGTCKLISCLKGKFYLVVVNCDVEHKQFGKWESFVLSEDNNQQIFIPPKFGNGHYVLSDEAIFHYKQSTYYGDYKQFTIKWDDPFFDILWPATTPVLSERDKNGPFTDFGNEVLYE